MMRVADYPAWFDSRALEIARQFTSDTDFQQRAKLQLEVIKAMRDAIGQQS